MPPKENGQNENSEMKSADIELLLKIGAFSAISFGTAFEIGYFQEFGIEFLSLAGVTDWLFATCLIGLTTIMLGVAFIPIAIFFDRSDARGNILLVVGLLAISLGVLGKLLHWPVLLAVSFGALFFMLCNVVVSLVKAHADPTFTKKPWRLPVLGIGVTLLTILGGGVYASIAGRECMFSFKDGHTLTAIYMRGLAEGYLAKLDDQRFYFPKAEVTELRCKGN